uniref:Ribonuclease H-like domain, reverse transcriptase, RNA-dependent DNA polymerase n=1 Tax=Tanacetum cinerariifolium TaxID=118510 RepID=A0A6L2MVG1_TANCI|nr:ribonuclease H-like domain, reverse transcriptase, RNA-dependent DNA polymerase [Tanacetum cinerariifolium]
MEAYLSPNPPVQVNKIASSCEICSGPYDTRYYIENIDQTFIDYASSRTEEARGKWFIFKPEDNNLGDTYNPSWKSHPNLRWRQPQNSQNNFSNPPNGFQPIEEEIVESNTIKDDNHNTIVKIEERVGEKLSKSETVIGKGESRDIKRDDPDNKACGDTKGVAEVDEESEESEEEVEEEENDPEYLDTFPTVKELRCHVTILNTIVHLGKFDGKADEGFFVGYSLNSKAFRVFNIRTWIVEETFHIRFSENTSNNVGTQTNGNASTKDNDNAGQARKKKVPGKDYILLPLWTDDPSFPQEPKDQEEKDSVNSTNRVNAVSSTINAASNEVNDVGRKLSIELPDDPNMPELEDINIFEDSNEDIKEEVYVCQPTGFKDPDFLNKVYKVEKAPNGLHQAPRAWYETLSTYLLHNGFHRGKIDKTLFIKRHKNDILLVQVYVDDIIFGSTKKELCNAFEKLMHDIFQMSSMGELTFFLGLQVKQKEDDIFISQDKYVAEILKKFGFSKVKTTSTPMKTQKPLLKDEDGEEVYVHIYRSMIGSLMCRLISWKCKKETVVANSTTEAEYVVASSLFKHFDKQLDGLSTHKEKYDVSFHTKKVFANMKRIGKEFSGKETPLFPTMVGPNQVQMGEGVGNSLVRATTTAYSLEAEQDSGNIAKTQTKTTSNEPSSQRTSSGDGPRRQDTMGDTSAHTRVINSSDDEALDKDDTSKLERIDKTDANKDIALVISAAETIVTTAPTITAESTKTNVEVTQASKSKGVTAETIRVKADYKSKAAYKIKTKSKGVMIQEPEETTTTKTASSQQSQVHDKGKGKAKMIEEPEIPKKRKHQIRVDEELAVKLQAKIDEEERLAREKSQQVEEVNLAWDDVHAKIEADCEMA